MTELLTAAQMRSLEQAAIASGAVTGLELMERAGRGVVEAILDEWPGFREGSHRAVVLCGPGNNGGDGFVVARLLKERGWKVEVFLYGDPKRMPPDARVNYERWRRMGEVVAIPLDPFGPRPAFVNEEDGLFVDALFGVGLSRSLSAELMGTSGAMMDRGGTTACWKRVAVDVPSGLCSDSGRPLKDDSGRSGAIPAHLTVTFHRLRLGHVLDKGPGLSGKSIVCDIGLESRQGDLQQQVWTSDYVTCEPSIVSKEDGHKFTHGHALILSGPATRTGACRLAARGALRIGAGLVTVACPPDAAPEHAARLDAIMLRIVPDAAALTDLLADPRINAVCIGPGLGLDAHAAALVAAVLAASSPRGPGSSPGREELKALYPTTNTTAPAPEPGPREAEALPPNDPRRHTILDADALTLLARDPALFAQLHQNCILTPHAGEFARLFPDLSERLNATPTTGPAYSKVDATRDAATRAGCTVLFKGPDTVISDPSGRCSINSAHYERSAPWLATAGSGDVLAGFITGLLARGFSPHDAACAAAWLHVECALSFGPGLIAEDLPEELPKVFRALKI